MKYRAGDIVVMVRPYRTLCGLLYNTGEKVIIRESKNVPGFLVLPSERGGCEGTFIEYLSKLNIIKPYIKGPYLANDGTPINV